MFMTSQATQEKAPEHNPRRKFLCVVDASPECATATQFAALRAKNTGGRVSLLYVIQPSDFQHWASVKDIMREEAREEAEEILKAHAKRVHEVSGGTAECIIREGKIQEQILEVINEDHDIRILVLGAASGNEGPGPLVSTLAGRDLSSRFPIPVLVVPGNLTSEEIEALT